MTLFQWALFTGLIVAGIGFGLLALAIATSPALPGHRHLLPFTPRRFRPAR